MKNLKIFLAASFAAALMTSCATMMDNGSKSDGSYVTGKQAKMSSKDYNNVGLYDNSQKKAKRSK